MNVGELSRMQELNEHLASFKEELSSQRLSTMKLRQLHAQKMNEAREAQPHMRDQLAKAGSKVWQMWFANRLWHPAKPTAPKVEFDLDVTDTTAAATSIIAAVGTGELSSDQAKDLVQSLAALSQIQEVEGIKVEIEELKQMLGGRI